MSNEHYYTLHNGPDQTHLWFLFYYFVCVCAQTQTKNDKIQFVNHVDPSKAICKIENVYRLWMIYLYKKINDNTDGNIVANCKHTGFHVR